MFQIDSIGRIARISIARPETRNAIPLTRWNDLKDAIARVAASDARALVLRSAVPGIFCAGADIADLGALRDDVSLRGRFRGEMGAAIEALAALPIPTIAAIDGPCFGAAVALAMACDIRLASEAAIFGTTPAKLGISYPAADVARLKALVGPGQAARLLFSAMTIDAVEAKAIGLIEVIAPDIDAAASTWAGAIAANAPSSVLALKRALGADLPADAFFDDSFGSPDFAEGLAAFRDRRRPVFEG